VVCLLGDHASRQLGVPSSSRAIIRSLSTVSDSLTECYKFKNGDLRSHNLQMLPSSLGISTTKSLDALKYMLDNRLKLEHLLPNAHIESLNSRDNGLSFKPISNIEVKDSEDQKIRQSTKLSASRKQVPT